MTDRDPVMQLTEPVIRTGNVTADVLIALSLCEQRMQVPAGTVQQFLSDKKIIAPDTTRKLLFHNAAMDAKNAVTTVRQLADKLKTQIEAGHDNNARAQADALATAVTELQRHNDKLDAIEKGRIS